MYPETQGVPLAEMDGVFGDGMRTEYVHMIECNISAEERLDLEDDDEGEITERSALTRPVLPSYMATTDDDSSKPASTSSSTSGWFRRKFSRRGGNSDEDSSTP